MLEIKTAKRYYKYMYFESREQAGVKLAGQLYDAYRYENCAVVALSDGGVVVGEQIASFLHCVLTMLVVEPIEVPGEGITIGEVSQTGSFVYNSDMSSGEIDGYVSEYNGYLQEKKLESFRKINRLIGDGGTIDRDLLRDRTVIVVDDGMADATVIDAVIDFIKPIRVERLVIASPFVSVEAVDKLHVHADKLFILDVKQNYLDTDHYYDRNDVPGHEETIRKINEIILNWR